MAIPYLACMALVAKFYALPPRVLPAIQAVEGGRPGMVSRNTDGTADLGVMQVNTRWIPKLASYAKMSPPDVTTRLISDPCFNIAAAGVIVRTYLNETHNNLIRAIGDYHSHTAPLNMRYRTEVLRAAMIMFESHVR